MLCFHLNHKIVKQIHGYTVRRTLGCIYIFMLHEKRKVLNGVDKTSSCQCFLSSMLYKSRHGAINQRCMCIVNTLEEDATDEKKTF